MIQMTKTSRNKWLKNALRFVIPPIVIYLGSLSLVLSQQDHFFTLNDLIPNSFALGSLVTWLISTLEDFRRKLGK